ncbi:PAS domain S-box protein [Devosia sp.]|uniref:sensor histidine kinase n=1 Tax=Devosia sp. TaxID=1871048 RepID=UPI0035B00AF9
MNRRFFLDSDETFRAILECAPDAMIIADADGVMLIVNAEAERLFDYPRLDLIGQPIELLMPERFRGAHPEHRAHYTAQPHRRPMGAGLELFGRRRDGSEIPVEISLAPLPIEGTGLTCCTIRDVSARRSAEEAHRRTMEAYRMAVEVAEIGTWFWDVVKDQITWSGQFRKLFGLQSDATLNYDEITRLIHPEDKPRIDAAIEAALRRDVPYDIEYRIVWPDGSVRWLIAKGRVRRNAEGTPLDMQGTITDVTERKRAQEVLRQREAQARRTAELMRSNHDLEQFAYVAAHDLQEPLRMVASFTQLLGQRYKGRLDADADEFIDFAVDGAQRMQQLIKDLLAYCRLGTGGQAPRRTSCLDALDEALRNLQVAISESGATITNDALPEVLADRAQLAQLFQNLIGNAIKYRSEQPPRIHVGVRASESEEWIFSVRDNGIGIDAKYHDRIFAMFQRLHGRTRYPGTGIGLTLCRKIVERHGGRIWVAPGSGTGTTFMFSLPSGGMD